MQWRQQIETYDVLRLVLAREQAKRNDNLVNIFGGNHTWYLQLVFDISTQVCARETYAG